MTYKHLVGLFALFFCCQKSLAQADSVYHLKEVIVADVQLQKAPKTQLINTLNEEDIRQNLGSLTQLLNNLSGLYFKENGAGMVSSVSFRGTSAQQTAVVWNGININSQLNGLTDFNTISSVDFSNIVIKSGGGSVLYGSGAVGGSIHLQNEAKHHQKSRFFQRVHFGSFNSQSGQSNWQYGNEKWAFNLGLQRQQSDNDYPYLGSDLKNENGRFYNQSGSATVVRKLNENNQIAFYSQWYDGQRDFSGSLGTNSLNQYVDWNTRNMLEFRHEKNRYEMRLKYAYLTEKYLFYENKYADAYNFGQAQTTLIRQENIYKFSEKTTWTAQFEFSTNVGKGSNFDEKTRKIGNLSLVWQQQLLSHLLIEGSVRAEQNDTYETPLLYAVSSRWEVKKNWALKAHLSKNYRIPTFNDLYWQGSGNTQLNPETAFQYEIGPEFKNKKWLVATHYFRIQLQDLLRWLPQSTGIWMPENTARVRNQGIEMQATFEEKINDHAFKIRANYTFTEAKNLKNNLLLIYVPQHKASCALNYEYKNIGAFFQTTYQSKVFTSSDNFYSLPPYALINAGCSYNIDTQKTTVQIGFQMQNLSNENYQNVVARPMPGRNFQLYLTFTL